MYNKLEIDVMQASDLLEATQIASKYKLPAIVVHQDIMVEAQIARGKVNGKYKIIIPIDWPKGEIFGDLKLRGLSVDTLDAEGFEILLTGNKSRIETKNEAKTLMEFIKRHLGELTEVRFVLGTGFRSEENISELCEGLIGVRRPDMIRTDINLKAQLGKTNIDTHNIIIENIKKIISAPTKISGNISSVKTISACKAERYAVNITQAKNIIKEFQQQPI